MEKEKEVLKNSSWRESRIIIPPKSEREVIFMDTRPNWFYINNLSSTELFVGILNIPTAYSYDFKVAPNANGMSMRDTGVDRIRVYNNSMEQANIVVQSMLTAFDPSVLVGNTNSTQSSGGGGGGVSESVSIKSFGASLPAGSNNIGKVEVSTMPDVSLELTNPLPTGTNKIGKVDVSSLPSIPTGSNIIGSVNVNSIPPLPEGTNVIGKVAIDGKIEIKEVIFGQDTTYVTNNSSIKDEEYVTSLHNFNMVNFLANDGDADLKCEIYKEDKVTLGDDIIIKKGESLQDFKIKGYGIKLTVAGKSGTCKYRYLTTNDK